MEVVLVEFAGLAPRAADLGAGTLQHLFVVRVLPLHQVFHELEQTFPLDGSLFLVHPAPQVALVAGVIDHLRKDHRPCRCQRPPRPPEVQRGRGAVANGLFPRSGNVDGIKRESNFDEFFGGFDGNHDQP